MPLMFLFCSESHVSQVRMELGFLRGLIIGIGKIASSQNRFLFFFKLYWVMHLGVLYI